MATIKLSAAVATGINGKQCHRREIKKSILVKTSKEKFHHGVLGASYRKGFIFNNGFMNCGLVSNQHEPEYESSVSGLEERFTATTEEKLINGTSEEVM